jgi:hypothetical protein
VLSNRDHGLKAGDRVRSIKTNYLPFVGTVEKIWTDLVKVRFDQAQGEHGFTVTPGETLEKLEDLPARIDLPRGGVVTVHTDGSVDVTAPVVDVRASTHTFTHAALTGVDGLLMNAPLPPHQPEEDPAIVYPLVDKGEPGQP